MWNRKNYRTGLLSDSKIQGAGMGGSKTSLKCKLKAELQTPKLKTSDYIEPDFDHYAKLLYLRKIRGIDDAYAYYCNEGKEGKKYSRTSFFRHFKQWRKKTAEAADTFLSHNWSAGDCCQIDYSGDTS